MRTLKKTLALVLVLAMMFSLCVTASADFADAEEITNAKAVATLVGLGVIEGMPDGTFDPAGTLTRAQAAKIVAYLHGVGEYAADGAETGFSDVPASHWASGYIAYCAEAGILDGYGDGKFGPSDPLTGYAWTKMLLCALGYDSAIEGYTGSAWQINVAKDAVYLKLWLGSEADNKAALSRDNACLYAFNILDKEVVAYDKDGQYSTQKAFDVANLGIDVIDGETVDEFGRPIDAVVGKGEKDVTYYAVGYEPILTYTAPVLREKVLKDLDDTQTDAKFTVYVDGEKKADNRPFEADDLKDEWSVSGNGVLVEIYDNSDLNAKNGNEYIAVVVNTYVAKITDEMITEAVEPTMTSKGADAYITIDGIDYKTDAFVKGDKIDEVVLYTKGMKGGKAVIASIEVIEATTGYVTAIGSDYFKLDGTKYEYSKNKDIKDGVIEATAKIDVYVDGYGYVILAETNVPAQAKTVWNYGYMTRYEARQYTPNTNNSLLGGASTEETAEEKFEIVTTDGEIVVFDGAFETAKDGTVTFVWNGETEAAEDVSAQLIKYALDEDGKIEKIAGADKSYSDVSTYTKGTATLMYDKDGVSTARSTLLTSKTIFIYQSTDEETGKYVYTICTGYLNAPSFAAAGVQGIVDENKAMAVLYIPVAGEEDVAPQTTKTYVYFATNDYETVVVDAEKKTTKVVYSGAYLDGVTGSLEFAAALEENVAGGLYEYTIDAKTGYAALGENLIADAAVVSAVESNYIKMGDTIKYVGEKTAYYNIDTLTNAVSAEAIPALSEDIVVSVVAIVGGADSQAKNAATIVYYTVADAK